MSSASSSMANEVGKEHLTVWWTTAALVVGHSLLAAGVLLLLLFIFTCIRRSVHHHQPKVFVPLPTPPICRRQISVHTVYPPTPPITRQQLSVYTICRPTPPDSPLISVGTSGKLPSSAPSFLSSPHIRRSLLPDTSTSRPYRAHLLVKSPLMPNNIPSAASLPGSPKLKPPRRTNSLPGWPQVSAADT